MTIMRRFAAIQRIQFLVVALFTMALAMPVSGAPEGGDWEGLRPVKQEGPSCAFFANVPALTLAAGVDISSSRTFTSSVYGLRRGDFKFERAFDKRIFCELFALPWEEFTVQHPEMPRKRLLPHAQELIRENIEPGLDKGRIYSLRVNGPHGGPHNVLLLGKTGAEYVVHDPAPGKIRRLTGDKLADLMLVRSTLTANRIKPVYITHYMAITPDRHEAGGAKPLKELPRQLELELTAGQRDQLRRKLTTASPANAPERMKEWMAAYPGIDFAALQRTDEKEPRNVIGGTLEAEELRGVLHLSQLHLALWHMNRRSHLPVVFMGGQPWAMVAYRRADATTGASRAVAFENGREQQWLPHDQALQRIHASGALIGTVVID